MALRELILGISRSSACRALDDFAEHYHDELSASRKSILHRDQHQCQFCGLRLTGKAATLLHVHHIDCNHKNNTSTNLITACVLCHLSHHLGYVGAMHLGQLVFIPGAKFSQAQFNAAQLAAWRCKRASTLASPESRTLRIAAMRTIVHYSDKLSELSAIRLGRTDPAFHAWVMSSLPDDVYNTRKAALSGVYLVFSEEKLCEVYQDAFSELLAGAMPVALGQEASHLIAIR